MKRGINGICSQFCFAAPHGFCQIHGAGQGRAVQPVFLRGKHPCNLHFSFLFLPLLHWICQNTHLYLCWFKWWHEQCFPKNLCGRPLWSPVKPLWDLWAPSNNLQNNSTPEPNTRLKLTMKHFCLQRTVSTQWRLFIWIASTTSLPPWSSSLLYPQWNTRINYNSQKTVSSYLSQMIWLQTLIINKQSWEVLEKGDIHSPAHLKAT